MKFKKQAVGILLLLESLKNGYSKFDIRMEGTNDYLILIGRFPNTFRFVFFNSERNCYIEFESVDIVQKLYINCPILEIGDWIAVEESKGVFKYHLCDTYGDCNEYNNRDDWRQVTHEEWTQLNSPKSINLPLSQEETTMVLQRRIEEAVRKSVQEAIEEWRKRNEAKNTAASTGD